jgi:hypothetical protein
MRMSDFALAGILAAVGAAMTSSAEAAENAGANAAVAEVARNCRREIAPSIILVRIDEFTSIQQRMTEVLERAVRVALTNPSL